MPRIRTHDTAHLGALAIAIDVLVEPASHDEDRVAHVRRSEGLAIVVADGAGNSGRGAEAAERAVASVHDVDEPASTLTALDRALARAGAEAAVLIALVTAHEGRLALEAAAAGDVRAWAHVDGAWHELTRSVARKPLVGSGAVPHELGVVGASALLFATDGLAALSALPSWAANAPLDALVDAVRLPTGPLVDDTSVLRLALG